MPFPILLPFQYSTQLPFSIQQHLPYCYLLSTLSIKSPSFVFPSLWIFTLPLTLSKSKSRTWFANLHYDPSPLQYQTLIVLPFYLCSLLSNQLHLCNHSWIFNSFSKSVRLVLLQISTYFLNLNSNLLLLHQLT